MTIEIYTSRQLYERTYAIREVARVLRVVALQLEAEHKRTGRRGHGAKMFGETMTVEGMPHRVRFKIGTGGQR